jgi:hypothetical protein
MFGESCEFLTMRRNPGTSRRLAAISIFQEKLFINGSALAPEVVSRRHQFLHKSETIVLLGFWPLL